MIDFAYVMPTGIYAGKSVHERFNDQINKLGDVPVHQKELGSCWVWIGKTFRNRYGCFVYKNRYLLAHRVAWELEYKVEPSNLVLHKCDNPSCVNICHLFEGTTQDNTNDRISKGRSKTAFGEQAGNAKLTDENVREIRTRYNTGNVFMKQLAKEYNVSQKQISVVISNKQWRHIANI